MTSFRFQGPIAFDTDDGRGVPVETLDGARLKRIDVGADDVQITYNDDNNDEVTVVIPASAVEQMVTQRAVVLSNADLKALDRTYVEIVPAPGNRRYIQLHNVWMRRRGADVPNTERGFYWALSEDTVLNDGDIAAGSGRLTQSDALDVDDNITTNGLQFRLDTWPGDEFRYIFVGSEVDEPEIDIYGIFTSPDPDSLFTPDAPWAGSQGYRNTYYTKPVPGTFMVNGVETKWWVIARRTDDTPFSHGSGPPYSASDNNISGGRLEFGTRSTSPSTRGGARTTPTLGAVATENYIGLLHVLDGSVPKPILNYMVATYSQNDAAALLYGRDVSAQLGNILALPANSVRSIALGGHVLIENTALVAGVLIDDSPARALAESIDYTAPAYQRYLEGVDDFEIAFVVRYSVHTAISGP